MRKILTVFLCISMALMLLIPTLAAEENDLEDYIKSTVENIDEDDEESDNEAGSLTEESAVLTVEEPTQIFNVIVPSSLDFIIDPFELAGKGQVYSEEFPIINCGETDVLLVFADIAVIFANDTEFESLAEPFDKQGFHDEKSAYLVLDFGCDDMTPFVFAHGETDLPIQIALYAEQDAPACALSISGSVNPYPANEWRDGDIRIQLTYQLEALQDESASSLSEEAESPEDLDKPEDLDGIEEPVETEEPEAPEEMEEPAEAKEPDEPSEFDEEGEIPYGGEELETDVRTEAEEETEESTEDGGRPPADEHELPPDGGDENESSETG